MDKQLEKLISFAKNEKWEEMDTLIPEICNRQEIIDWSLKEGVKDADWNVRDLAVSLLERSAYNLNVEDITLLNHLMQNDKNIYVQFRAAFTLFNRGEETQGVMNKMKEALKDDDVKEIAAKYLVKI